MLQIPGSKEQDDFEGMPELIEPNDDEDEGELKLGKVESRREEEGDD